MPEFGIDPKYLRKMMKKIQVSLQHRRDLPGEFLNSLDLPI
jgi:hypothetical protein